MWLLWLGSCETQIIHYRNTQTYRGRNSCISWFHTLRVNSYTIAICLKYFIHLQCALRILIRWLRFMITWIMDFMYLPPYLTVWDHRVPCGSFKPSFGSMANFNISNFSRFILDLLCWCIAMFLFGMLGLKICLVSAQSGSTQIALRIHCYEVVIPSPSSLQVDIYRRKRKAAFVGLVKKKSAIISKFVLGGTTYTR